MSWFHNAKLTLGRVGSTAITARLVVRLLLVVLVLVALLRLTWTERAPGQGFWSFLADHLEKGFLEAFVLACLLALMAEIPIFRTSSESHLRDVVDADFIARASDPGSLRRLSPEARQQIEAGTQEAAFPGELPPALKNLLPRLSGLRRDLTLYRTDYVEVVRYRDIASLPVLYCLEALNGRYKYNNIDDTAKDVRQYIRGAWYHSAGVKDDDCLKFLSLTVDGENLLDRLTVAGKKTEAGGRVELTAYADFMIAARGMRSVEFRYSEILPKTEPWFHSFFCPVYGFDLTLLHPPTITPKLYAFGVGSPEATDPLPPEAATDEMHRWLYRGWFLRDQGFVVTFAQTPSGFGTTTAD